MTEALDIALLVGRLLFGGFFLISGVRHLTDAEPMSQYAASQNVPAPKLSVIATGLLLIAGAGSVLLGVYPRIGLTAIAVFLVVVSPTMHAFWTLDDAQQRASEQTQFMKNAALLGAALALMTLSTPWVFALGA